MMETRNLIIICVVIIVCVLVGAVAVASNQPDKTQINVLSNSSLYTGENVTVQLTTENGTPIANQTVNITLVDSNGGRNVQTVIVNEDGIAILTLGGVTAGNYTLECSFGGSDGYESSNCTSALDVKEEVKQETSSYSSNNYIDDYPYKNKEVLSDGGIKYNYYDGGYEIRKNGVIVEMGDPQW